MFSIFRRRKAFDNRKKQVFVDAISDMLRVQLAITGGSSIEDAKGNINRKAIGYIYGFIDGALRTIGQNMADESVGVPITFHVLKNLFPGREERYTQYLINHMGTDETVTLGAMTGGQEYLDFAKKKIAAPMGLARYIMPTEVQNVLDDLLRVRSD